MNRIIIRVLTEISSCFTNNYRYFVIPRLDRGIQVHKGMDSRLQTAGMTDFDFTLRPNIQTKGY
jgi:hypothetical protein